MNKRALQPESCRKNATPQQCQRYAETLKEMVDCKTVFLRNGENQGEFDRFYEILAKRFPLLIEKAERLTFGSGCFVYVLRGSDARKNIMLMSHHDVVEATPGWNTDAFDGQIREGALYGRGTIDTKTPLFAELQACEELLAQGYSFPGLNVYIGSSNNEEVCGDGMVLAEQYFRQQGIRFDAIVDEGGAITTGMVPGVEGKSAMVAVHEKSRHLYLCTTQRSTVGHGGLIPSKDSAIRRLTDFMREVETSKIYKSHFSEEVRATFETHAPYMKFPLNVLFGHFSLFGPLLKAIMQRIPQASAMLSTGISFTSIFAGSKDDPQIQAKQAQCTLFLRCVREEDLQQGMKKIEAIAEKYGVQIQLLERDYCQPTSFTGRSYQILEETLHENFPDVIVSPFLLTAGTDARRFTDIADSILRFAPIDLDKAQYASIHGDNEHIKIQNVGQCVCFYRDLIQKFARG